MSEEGLADARSHEEVKGRDSLSSMLLVLIGLEDDSRQRGIALNALWGTNATILGVEASLEEVV